MRDCTCYDCTGVRHIRCEGKISTVADLPIHNSPPHASNTPGKSTAARAKVRAGIKTTRAICVTNDGSMPLSADASSCAYTSVQRHAEVAILGNVLHREGTAI